MALRKTKRSNKAPILVFLVHSYTVCYVGSGICSRLGKPLEENLHPITDRNQCAPRVTDNVYAERHRGSGRPVRSSQH